MVSENKGKYVMFLTVMESSYPGIITGVYFCGTYPSKEDAIERKIAIENVCQKYKISCNIEIFPEETDSEYADIAKVFGTSLLMRVSDF